MLDTEPEKNRHTKPEEGEEEMSEIQRIEEETYDRHSEYYAVMQAEADDPYLFADYCEQHDEGFILPAGCPGCFVANPEPNIIVADSDDEDPLF